MPQNSCDTPENWLASLFTANAELIVAEGERRQLSGGLHRFDLVEIRSGGTLECAGNGDLFVAKLITLPGAKIRIFADHGAMPCGFRLHCLDASGLRDLTLALHQTGRAEPARIHWATMFLPGMRAGAIVSIDQPNHADMAPEGPIDRGAWHCDLVAVLDGASLLPLAENPRAHRDTRQMHETPACRSNCLRVVSAQDYVAYLDDLKPNDLFTP